MNRHFRFIRKTASSILMSSSEVLSLHYLHKTAITLVATLVGTISVSGSAEAIDFNWIAGTGGWENDSNWSNGFGSMAPDEDAFAFVDNGGTAQVQTTYSVAGYVYIGNVNSGALDIFGGGQLEGFYNNVIGGNAGSSGAVTVDGIGSSWQLAGPSASLDVGASGEGSLTITNGGEVLNADSFLSTSIGANAGSSGTVTVDGAGSKLTNINAGIFVGNSGNGTLNILNGGSASNTSGSVGRLSGGIGIATVDGVGSSWNNTSRLYLGDWGNGTLTIINDGLVAVDSGAAAVELGRFGGSGTVNIGNGGAAGILNAAAVNGGSGSATLNFNHNESNYFFTDDSTSGGDTIRITGTTYVNFTGSGTTYISGNNTYTGSTNISSGKLVVYNGGTLGNKSAVTVGTGAMLEALSDLTIGSLAGNGTVDVDTGSGGFTLTVGGDNTSTVFSGTIIDFSYLTKTGTGTLTMTGNNPYYGATIVNDGLLVVNGSIANSGTTVNAGGALGGSGTLGSITINGGSLAPGNSIGTMNVSGSVDFSGGGVYEVEVDAAGNSDLINATAMATLTNGTVLVLPEVGDYSLSTDYTILSAAGGLGGTTFNSVSSNLAFLTPTLTYDANNVFLNLRRNSTDYASVANTPNQTAVSTTLDTVAGTPNLDNLFNNLNILSAQGAQQAYDSLSGVQHTHSNLIALQSMNQFQDLLLNRLQSGSPLANNGQIQLAYNDTGTMTDAGTSLIGEKPANTRGWWLRGTGSYADIDGTSNASGAYYKSAGTAAGRDIFVDDALTVGLAVGYNRTDASVSQGSLDVDSYQAALYGRKLFTDNYYVSGIAGVGYHEFESKRRVTVGLSNTTARADYHAWTSNIAVEIGRLIEVSENTNLTPLAGLEYAHVNRAGFVEKDANAANLKIRRDQQDSLRSAIGARIEHLWKTQKGYRIQPTAELAWVHELMDNEAQMRAGFAATSLANFQVDGPELDRNRARLALGLDMQLSELSSIQLGYQGEWASSDQRHDLSATFRMAW